MSYLSGTTGYVKIGSTSYSFKKWSLSMDVKMIPVNNFTSAGAQEIVSGFKSATLTVEGPYNQGSMAFTVGTQYTFLCGFDTGVEISVPAKVSNITPDVDADGGEVIKMTAMSNGSVTLSIS